MPKRWQKTDLAYLKRRASTKSLRELALRFKTDPQVVKKKLDELGLTSRDGQSGATADASVELYEQALKAMYREKWAEAAKQFARVAADSDWPELRARARLLRDATLQRQSADSKELAEEPFLLAVYHKNRGELAEALQICARGGRQGKDERFAYLAASIHALQGDDGEAARLLAHAIELNPKNRIHAYHDPDFAGLRERRDLGDLGGHAG